MVLIFMMTPVSLVQWLLPDHGAYGRRTDTSCPILSVTSLVIAKLVAVTVSGKSSTILEIPPWLNRYGVKPET